MERELSLHSLSPLVLHAERSRTQFTPSLDYIPGSTLRGAVAAHYLQAQGEDEAFHELFVSGRACFPDMLPSHQDDAGRLLPATARLCKRHGWKHAQSLTDALLRLALADMTDCAEPLSDRSWEYCSEQDCQAINKRDRAQGYVTSGNKQVETRSRLLTGTSISRFTGTAESGMLFSQQALQERQFFKGVVRVHGDGAAELQARLEQTLYTGTRLRIGAARSRGLGLVELKEWADSWGSEELTARVDSFNQALRELAERYKTVTDGAAYFAMTLESHLILRDQAGRAVTQIRKGPDLSELMGLAGVTLGRHVILPAVVRGWNAQQGLPKEDEPTVGRGSALLFRIDPGSEEAVYQALARIERDGLGRRRSEGFGRVRVCDPFHYRFILQELEETRR